MSSPGNVAVGPASEQLQAILNDHAFVGKLLSEYKTLPQQVLPLIGNGHVACAVSDGRATDIASLSTKDAALAFVILVCVARVSSDPVIAGQGAKDAADSFLKARRHHLDLRAFGQARDSLCLELETRARAYALAAGVGLDLQPNSVLISLLAGHSHSARDQGGKTWTDAGFQTLRALREREEAVNRANGAPPGQSALSQSICVNLAIAQVVHNILCESVPRIRADDDLLLYRECALKPDVQAMLAASKTSKERVMGMWDVLAKAAFETVCSARDIAERLYAPCKPITDDAALHTVRTLLQISSTMETIESQLRSCLPPLGDGTGEHASRLAVAHCYFDSTPLWYSVVALCAYNTLAARALTLRSEGNSFAATLRADRADFDAAQMRKLVLHVASMVANAFAPPRMPELSFLCGKVRLAVVDEWAALVRDADDMELRERARCLSMYVVLSSG